MKWDVEKLKDVSDPIREAAGLSLGVDGEFFISNGDYTVNPALISGNHPPSMQPNLWCQWVPSDDGKFIEWNEGERFYQYVEWIEYIIEKFLIPWGYILDGKVQWQGENEFDNGVIVVKANKIDVLENIIINDSFDNLRRLRVFICHSSNDKPTARELYNQLIEDGIDPWLDEEILLPGQDWELEIRKAIKNTDIVLVCLSNNSVNKIGFVQKEIKFALDVADEQPEGSIFVIPLKLDNCVVPERLKRWHWVDYHSSNGYSQVVLALRKRAEQLSHKIE